MKSPSIKKKPIKQNITKTKQEKPQKYINKNINKKYIYKKEKETEYQERISKILEKEYSKIDITSLYKKRNEELLAEFERKTRIEKTINYFKYSFSISNYSCSSFKYER